MNKYLWASPHVPTKVQLAELNANGGEVEYLGDINHDLFVSITKLSKDSDYIELAIAVINYVNDGYVIVQPGGNPKLLTAYGFVMNGLGLSLDSIIFAFSERVSIDKEQPDGTVIKSVVFNHERFI